MRYANITSIPSSYIVAFFSSLGDASPPGETALPPGETASPPGEDASQPGEDAMSLSNTHKKN